MRVILTGWKQISKHLGYGVRTVQRWEHQGLPVKRIGNNPHSPVVADSDQLDGWLLRGLNVPPNAPRNVRDVLQRAQELRREVERNRKELRRGLQILRKELAELREKLPTKRNSSGVR